MGGGGGRVSPTQCQYLCACVMLLLSSDFFLSFFLSLRVGGHLDFFNQRMCVMSLLSSGFSWCCCCFVLFFLRVRGYFDILPKKVRQFPTLFDSVL